jgi:hypothetical protein
MRQIHPVGFQEQFVASGRYVYHVDQNSTGMAESWSIYQLPDQSKIIRVDRDARKTAANTSILLEALENQDDWLERFDIHLYNPNGKNVRQAKASYIFFDQRLHLNRQINDVAGEQSEIELPENALIYPLLHVFTGKVIKQIASRNGQSVPVFLPRIDDLDDPKVLSVIFDDCSAYQDGQDTISLAGRNILVSRYRFIGGLYTKEAAFWLDEHDLLIASEYQLENGHHWRVCLEDYARRPVVKHD